MPTFRQWQVALLEKFSMSLAVRQLPQLPWLCIPRRFYGGQRDLSLGWFGYEYQQSVPTHLYRRSELRIELTGVQGDPEDLRLFTQQYCDVTRPRPLGVFVVRGLYRWTEIEWLCCVLSSLVPAAPAGQPINCSVLAIGQERLVDEDDAARRV